MDQGPPRATGLSLLLAGDIGATTTRLALVSPEAGPRRFLAEQEFPSRDFDGLQPIVEIFLGKCGQAPGSACFDVAGPVIEGRAHLTNLRWDLDEAGLCSSLHLDRVTLLNDLEAVAHAVPHLEPGEVTEINAGRAVAHSPIAILAPGSARRSSSGVAITTSPAPRKAATPTSHPPTPCRQDSGPS